jgi:hypothetical protein
LEDIILLQEDLEVQVAVQVEIVTLAANQELNQVDQVIQEHTALEIQAAK